MRRRWRRLTLRRRIVISSSLLVLVALVIATVAVAALFTSGRLHDLDRQTGVEADTVLSLVTTGQLPDVLPVPPGSPLLAQVLDARGAVLAATPSASRSQALAELHVSGADVATDEGGGYDGTPLRTRLRTATLSGRPVTIVVAAPLNDIRRELRALRTVLLIVVPLLVLGAAAVVSWVAGRTLRPVEQLRAAAAELAQNPGPHQVLDLLPEQPGGDEIARLGQTLNVLLRSLSSMLERQSAFVTNAAHELRSPLASLQVQIDVARAHPDLVVLDELLNDLGSEASRLITLAEDLLALARLDARSTGAMLSVDLTALAHATGPQVLVRGDEAALRRMVANLVSNAHQHGSRVALTTTVAEGMAQLDVDDDGAGIPVADRQRVFERWVRIDTSRARSDGGAGLGLALVHEIAKAHGGTVSVHDSPWGGARLRVRLPLDSPASACRSG
ncbi:MAG: mprB [Nocardioides sp.]|nr:mprB [Nocardioides sp.]